jgi:hypothetical protein
MRLARELRDSVFSVIGGASVSDELSLTVEVNDNELQWSFGPGLWTYRLLFGDIEKVAIMRNHWWNGQERSGFRL